MKIVKTRPMLFPSSHFCFCVLSNNSVSVGEKLAQYVLEHTWIEDKVRKVIFIYFDDPYKTECVGGSL